RLRHARTCFYTIRVQPADLSRENVGKTQRQDFAGHGIAIFADDPVRDRIGRSLMGPAAQPRREHVVPAVARVGPLRDKTQHQLAPSLQKQKAIIALDAHRRGLVDRFGSSERVGDVDTGRRELEQRFKSVRGMIQTKKDTNSKKLTSSKRVQQAK
ncbi:hypothetical protein, partial [Xanthomonas populi]|uniref:hypothetical protein n=1 Tax=Xanthomonas populi TaxID=53414 RepID=UPI001ABF64AA